jgi:hypothetical protein
VEIDSETFPFLNVSAEIHLYGLELLRPVIMRNDEKCPPDNCQILEYLNGNLSFNVTQFSVYFAKGSCSDGTVYGDCSTSQPEYCQNGSLVNRADICGCPTGYSVSETDCVDEGTGGSAGCTDGEKTSCSKKGVCKPSYQTCTNGVWGPCEGPEPETEVCDGKDNDCDGETDEMCMCVPGDKRVCGPDTETGACRFGVSECVDGAWGECKGDVNPTVETCDNIDNDCDGETDEGCDHCINGLKDYDETGVDCGGEDCKSCPDFPWWVLIVVGAVIIALLLVFLKVPKGDSREKRWEDIRKKYASPEPKNRP